MSDYRTINGSRIHTTAQCLFPAKITLAGKSKIEENAVLDPAVPAFSFADIDEGKSPAPADTARLGTISLGAGVYVGANSRISPPAVSSYLPPPPVSSSSSTAVTLALPSILSQSKAIEASYFAVVIADGAYIGAHARVRACFIGGDVRIGEGARIADGTVLLESCIVPAGSQVPSGVLVPPFAVWMGTASTPITNVSVPASLPPAGMAKDGQVSSAAGAVVPRRARAGEPCNWLADAVPTTTTHGSGVLSLLQLSKAGCSNGGSCILPASILAAYAAVD